LKLLLQKIIESVEIQQRESWVDLDVEFLPEEVSPSLLFLELPPLDFQDLFAVLEVPLLQQWLLEGQLLRLL